MTIVERAVDWLAGDIERQIEAAKKELDEAVEFLTTELGVTIDDSGEDEPGGSRLIPMDKAIAELFRIRDETLDDYVPSWGELATGQIEAKFDLWVHGARAVFEALNRFNFRPLRDVFREWVLLSSPRGLIVAVQKARDAALQRLDAAALGPSKRKRRWKKISSRNPSN